MNSTVLPLSMGQRDIWVAHYLDRSGCAYNMGGFLDLVGPLDIDLLSAAVRLVSGETDSLRVRFEQSWDGVFQLVAPDVSDELTQVDLSDEADPLQAARVWMQTDLRRPVDLLSSSLFELALVKLTAQHHLLYQRFHHICMDAVSMVMVTRRIAERYTALCRREEWARSSFGSLSVLLEEESAYRASAHFVRDGEYWSAMLAELPRVEGAVPDHPKAAISSATTRNSVGYLAESDSAALLGFAGENDIPWWVVLVAATAAYLHAASGETDVILSLPVHGRVTPAARATPGMVANMLPLRLRVEPNASFADLVAQTVRQVTGALRHQRYRYEDIRRSIGHRRDPGGWWPVVNILDFGHEYDFHGLEATGHPLAVGASYELSFSAYGKLNAGPIRLDMDASAELYPGHLLEREHARYLAHLNALLAKTDVPLLRALSRL